MTRTNRIAVAALAFVSAAVTPSAGAPDPKADAAYQEGLELYKARDYEAAASKFEAAYAIDSDPSYVFNAGQAYRLAANCAKASAAYKLYLFRAVQAPNIDTVQGYIEEMDRCAARQAAEEEARKPRLERRVIDAGGPRRNVGIGFAAAGGAALAGALWFTRNTNVLEDARGKVCPPSPEVCDWTMARADRAADLESRGERSELVARILYAVGGAALVTGVTFYLLGRNHDEVIFVPQPGGGVVGASVAF